MESLAPYLYQNIFVYLTVIYCKQLCVWVSEESWNNGKYLEVEKYNVFSNG